MESRSAAKVNEERESLRKSAFCAVSCVNASGHQRVQGTCNVNKASKQTGKPGKQSVCEYLCSATSSDFVQATFRSSFRCKRRLQARGSAPARDTGQIMRPLDQLLWQQTGVPKEIIVSPLVVAF